MFEKLSPLTRLLPQAVVAGSETSVVLQPLRSFTEYQLSVFAVYSNKGSEALRGSEKTRKCKSVLQTKARVHILGKLTKKSSKVLTLKDLDITKAQIVINLLP